MNTTLKYAQYKIRDFLLVDFDRKENMLKSTEVLCLMALFVDYSVFKPFVGTHITYYFADNQCNFLNSTPVLLTL